MSPGDRRHELVLARKRLVRAKASVFTKKTMKETVQIMLHKAEENVKHAATVLKNLQKGGKLSVSMCRMRVLIHNKEGTRAVPAIVRLTVSSEGGIHELISARKHLLTCKADASAFAKIMDAVKLELDSAQKEMDEATMCLKNAEKRWKDSIIW